MKQHTLLLLALAAASLVAPAPGIAAAPTLEETTHFISEHFPLTQPVDGRPIRARSTRLLIDGCNLQLTTRDYTSLASCKAPDVFGSAQAFAGDFDRESSSSIALHSVTGAQFDSLLRRITLALEPGYAVIESRVARKRPANTSEMSGNCREIPEADAEIVNRDLQIGAMAADGVAQRVAKALNYAAKLCRKAERSPEADTPF